MEALTFLFHRLAQQHDYAALREACGQQWNNTLVGQDE
jgi:hypothetical protein